MAYDRGRRYIRNLQHKLGSSRKGMTIDYSVFDFDLVHFTAHALDRMKERGIRRHEVLDVLESPDKTDLPTQTDRERYRQHRSKHEAIDVVFQRWPTKLCIVTVMVIER